MPDKRRVSTQGFKREAVRLVTDQGDGAVEAARHLGLKASRLGRWKRAVEQTMHGAFPGTGRGSQDQGEVCRWREEHRRLQMARDSLTKPWTSGPARRKEKGLHQAAPGGMADGGVV